MCGYDQPGAKPRFLNLQQNHPMATFYHFFKSLSLTASFLMLLFGGIKLSAQQANDCTSCGCPDGIFFGACNVKCCKPSVPACVCGNFSARCTCTGGVAYMPELHEQNIRDFALYLRGGAFDSNPAQNAAGGIDEMLLANAANQSDLVFTIGDRVNQFLLELPAGEKQAVNQWLVSRGGQSITIH